MKTATQTKADKHETNVVDGMIHAREIAEKIFAPSQLTDNAVFEIYDYLEQADEDEFIADLTRVAEHAKQVNKTTAPTPDQVFGLFERIFGE